MIGAKAALSHASVMAIAITAMVHPADARAAPQSNAPSTGALAAPQPTSADMPQSDQRTSAATAGSDVGVGDIIVTANRRQERLQDVPVAVTLVDGRQLTRQNVNTVEDLARTAPALNLAGPSGFGALSVRGVGGLSFSRTSDGSVGVVVDGVALANTSINPPLLFDIARVEVLEGPQGMLFGRNASAGVLNIVTNAPDPTRTEVIAHADLGTRNNYVGRVAVNVPVAANAAFRIAGSFAQDPQIQKNLADDSWLRQQNKSVRGRFLWEPSASVTVNVSGDYTDAGRDGGTPWAVHAATPGSALSQRLAACGVVVGPSNTEGCVNDGNLYSVETYGGSAQVDLALGASTLTSITAYRGTSSNLERDVDSTTANRVAQSVQDTADNFSQELRLSSQGRSLVEYVGGLYYFNGKTTDDNRLAGHPLADLPLIGACPFPTPALCALPLGQDRRTETDVESYAAFGQATVHVTKALSLILGGRLGREDVGANATASVAAPGTVAPFIVLPALDTRTRDTYFSYRVGVQYDFSRNLMVFGSYTRGYKGPAVNDQGAGIGGAALIVRPEIPKAAEVGFKATLAEGRIGLNATAFHTKIIDYQAQFIDVSTGTAIFVFANGPSATVKGVSANLFGKPFAGFVANAGIAYTDSRYGAGFITPDLRGMPTDSKGMQLVGSPKWKATASAEYSTALSERLNGFVQADLVYSSRVYSDAVNSYILSLRPATVVGGRIGVKNIDDRFGISVFVRNLFDTFRPTARFITPSSAEQLDPGSAAQFAGPESHRVIGLSFDARF